MIMKTNRLIKPMVLFVIALSYTSAYVVQGQDIKDLKNILESKQFVLKIETLETPPLDYGIGEMNEALIENSGLVYVDPSFNVIYVDSSRCTTHLPLKYSFWRVNRSLNSDSPSIEPVTGKITNYKLRIGKRENAQYVVSFNMDTQRLYGLIKINVIVSIDSNAIISIASISDNEKLVLRGKLIAHHE